MSDIEIKVLAYALMTEIKEQYPAPYFIGSMTEIKAEAEAIIRMIQSKQGRDERDPARITLLDKLIEICESMIERGFDAAETSNETIRLQ